MLGPKKSKNNHLINRHLFKTIRHTTQKERGLSPVHPLHVTEERVIRISRSVDTLGVPSVCQMHQIACDPRNSI